jgi:hypothetical protein
MVVKLIIDEGPIKMKEVKRVPKVGEFINGCKITKMTTNALGIIVYAKSME